MNNPKRLIAVAAIILIATAGVLALLTNRPTKPSDQVLAVTLPANTAIDIYQASEAEAHGTGSSDLGKPVATVTKNEELRLTRGEYVAILKESADFKPFSQRFSLESSKYTLTVSPDYTEAKLASLLATERPAILTALTTAYPQLASLYTIQEGWLYKQGEWYATKLLAKSTSASQSDTLRVILHKEGSTWKVVTNPPDITISGPRHPEIPLEIVTDINNFK